MPPLLRSPDTHQRRGATPRLREPWALGPVWATGPGRPGRPGTTAEGGSEAADERKTRQQLLGELRRMREEVAQAEASEGEQGDAALGRSEQETRIRSRIGDIFLTVRDDEMYAEVLEVVLEATDSKYGVFAYIDEQGDLVCASMTREVWEKCQVPDKDIVFPRDSWGGMWGRALRERRTLHSNEPRRVPEGHIAIDRVVVVPILHRDEAIGIFEAANKATDYTAEDIRALESIAAYVAPVLRARLERDREEVQRRQAEERIESLNAKLEERVVELEASNRELEAFCYSVSHDLRAPLRSMDGFSGALLEDYGDRLDENGRHHLERVRRACQRMGRLIDDLLELSRIARQDMRRGSVDLSALAHEIVEELQRREPEREVELAIAEGVVAEGDATLLRVALQNLLDNAWKFTSPHPRARIELGVTEYNGQSAYFVRDDGVGFDMAYADKLFEAFQRLHSEAEFGGTGIGLATVQRIVQRHGGRVWAEGEVERGCSVYFTL